MRGREVRGPGGEGGGGGGRGGCFSGGGGADALAAAAVAPMLQRRGTRGARGARHEARGREGGGGRGCFSGGGGADASAAAAARMLQRRRRRGCFSGGADASAAALRGVRARGAGWWVQAGVARQLQELVDREEGAKGAYLAKGDFFSDGGDGGEIHRRGRSTVEGDGKGEGKSWGGEKRKEKKRVKKRGKRKLLTRNSSPTISSSPSIPHPAPSPRPHLPAPHAGAARGHSNPSRVRHCSAKPSKPTCGHCLDAAVTLLPDTLQIQGHLMDHNNNKNHEQMDDTFQSENIRRNSENMNSDGLSICGQSNAPKNISDDFDADLDNHDEPNSLMQDRDAMEVVSEDPYIGKEFNSAEEARTFYNSYAFRLRFSIRKASQYKARKQDGMMTSMLLTCSKEGQSKVRDYDKRSSTTTPGQVTPTKEFLHKRSGCNALMRVKMIKEGKWVVTRFIEEHNHDLIASPTKTHFLRSHRSISNKQKQVIQLLRDQNISTSQIMSYIAARDGGSQNINFTMKDLSNEIVRYEKEEEEEFKTTDGESSLWSLNPIEKQAREIYTKVIFSDFKKHLRDATGFGVIELEQYKLYKTTLLENIYTLKQRSCSYKVAIEVETEKIFCNCKQFEFTGILCPHALRVMQHVGMNFIPTRKPQRYKPPAEMKAKKSRTCANCKKRGHNTRTCKEGLTVADCLDGESSESSGSTTKGASFRSSYQVG
ncbi:Protein FAR1-RELATED SEQUENCE 5 [Ananas comosus]|uniref:Protein FAR1-RELATED SEQUENCE 5 n=1 Tax=Ananas comosus TaxID=4615 RepID=A0A199UTY3_ANACO|nr:Protein FAR1-RELATED SEQUENCE 5 [Ananas comosus]